MAEPDTINWHVRISPNESRLYIEAQFIAHPNEVGSLPAWIPGSYLIREFVRGITRPQATDHAGRPVYLERCAKAGWRFSELSEATAVRVRYEVYGHELSVRSAHIDSDHAFFNGANAFLRFSEHASSEQSVHIDASGDWQVWCSLDERHTEHGARWFAADYVELADTPFEIGAHRTYSFDVEGVPHRFIFWGAERAKIDIPRLAAETTRLIETNRRLWAERLPYPRYDFIFHVTPHSRGGLEHRTSTTLATPSSWFRLPENADDETPEGYLDLLTLIAHEHFHAWNGRRLSPASLEPPNFDEEMFTEELWVIEGFTSYYDELNTLRSGLMPVETYLKRLATSLNRLESTPGRFQQSLEEASFDAWIRLYRPWEHSRNQTVSYYLKGALVSLAIDLLLRTQSAGRCSLDDVVAELWHSWHLRGRHYTSSEVLDLIAKLGGERCGQLARPWVQSPADPPFETLLREMGVLATYETDASPFPGFELGEVGGQTLVRVVRDDGPARHTELVPGDELIAIDGERVTSTSFNELLSSYCAGDEVTLTYSRFGQLRSCPLKLAAPRGTWKLTLDENAAADTRERRNAWLGHTDA